MRVSDLMVLGREALKFSIFLMILVLIIWGIGYKLIYKTTLHGKKSLSIKKVVPYGLLMVVILVIVYVTLLRGIFGGRQLSLIPFVSYKLAWYQFNPMEWRNIILNICMFIPFGFMLPIANKKFRKAWKTYLAGFVFTLLIEVLQIILKRGIFETDDLMNNLLGTIIGYGFFSIASAIANKKFSKKIVFLQIPLILAIFSFVIIFTSYYQKELGNMIYESTSKHKMPTVSISEEIELSSEETISNIYKMKIASVEETRQFAEKIFAIQGKTIDDRRTDIYDDTAVYYSNENTLSLWIDYKGFTVWYKNYELAYSQDGTQCNYLSGADEQIVRNAIEKIGFTIPKQVSYSTDNDGNYVFETNGKLIGERYCTGTVNCKLNEQGEVVDMRYNIVTSEPYKQTSLISSQEAYDLLCSGNFYYEDSIPNDLPLTVTNMELVYFADSKGFYQPMYRFILDNGSGKDIQIDIMARKMD